MRTRDELKLVKKVFEDIGVPKKDFQNIEDKIISMNHLGFSDMQTFARLRIEVKKYIENSEKYKYDFVNSAEKFDYSVDFLYD